MIKCPFTKKNCFKDKCGLWIELIVNKEKCGKCSIASMPILLIELRETIERIIEKTKRTE